MIKMNYTTLWYFPLFSILLVVALNIEAPRTFFTILGYGVSVDIIVAFILGLIPFIFIKILNWRHYPSRLFKTQFDPNRNINKENFGKPLVLEFNHSQIIYGFHFFVESKRLVDNIERIGIRPQSKIPTLKSWLTSYNNKAKDIDLDERDNPPIRIVEVKDVTCYSNQTINNTVDDGACGKWLYYSPAIKMKPNSKMIFWVEIQVNKSWKGYIDFILNTDDGRRVAHHSCELRRRKLKNDNTNVIIKSKRFLNY